MHSTQTHLALRVSLSPFADAFDTYQTLTGAVLDSNTGLLRLTPDQFANLQSLFFQIGDVSRLHHRSVSSVQPLVWSLTMSAQNTLEFTPNAQIWPRAVRVTS